MARVTVEDCLQHVDNRFDLVILSSKRAHQLATGGRMPKVTEDGDKPTVLALREIAEGVIDADFIEKEAAIKPEPIFISLPNYDDDDFKF